MKINKDIGNWCIKGGTFNTTELDDLAYSIYCHQRNKRFPKYIASQAAFVTHSKVYKLYYEQAKTVIRNEKIKKINDKNK